MKRYLILALLILITYCGFSQNLEIDSVSGAISYTEIVKADSLTAVELLKLSKKWVVTVFGAGKDMIDYYDEADSTMIIKPVITITTKISMPVGYAVKELMNEYTFRYVFEIEAKKGRYRIYAHNFKGEVKLPDGGKAPVESIFFDEARVIDNLKMMKEVLPKKTLKYMPELRPEDIKQERIELQNKLDSDVRDSFQGLKEYIRTRPKKNW